VVLPADTVAWGASSFQLSARILVNGSAACAGGCVIFYKVHEQHTVLSASAAYHRYTILSV
jgi:hypothetical protein